MEIVGYYGPICIDKGSKILIPVFALGRAQELFILLETNWEKMNIKCRIYFSAGMTEKANNYYKTFISMPNEKIMKTFVERNMSIFTSASASRSLSGCTVTRPT